MPGAWRRLDSAARGSIPVLVPLAFHAETIQFFSWLLPAGAVLPSASIRQAALFGVVVAAAFIAASALSRIHWPELLRVIVLGALFALFPPLVSFAIYFCVWHAPRHVISVGRRFQLSPKALSRALALVAAPLTLAALALAIGAWMHLRATGIEFAPATAQVVFIGLSALTAPHMLAGMFFEENQ